MSSITAWIKAHTIFSLAIALVLGSGIGAAGALASSEGKLDVLRADIAAMEQELKEQSSELVSLQGAVQDAEGALAEAEERADEAEAEAESKYETKYKRQVAELDKTRAQLRRRKNALDERQAKIAQTERVISRSKFSDGVWQVGKEIPAGIYRASAGSSCYWAILGSADTDNIINNGGFTANQTVTLRSGNWFQTSNCGQWNKIG